MSLYFNEVDNYRIATLFGEDSEVIGKCIIVNRDDLYSVSKKFVQYYLPEVYYEYFIDADPLKINRPHFNGIYIKESDLENENLLKSKLGLLFSNSALLYEPDLEVEDSVLCYFGFEVTLQKGSESLAMIYCPRGTKSVEYRGDIYSNLDADYSSAVLFIDDTVKAKPSSIESLASLIFNLKGFSLNRGFAADDYTYLSEQNKELATKLLTNYDMTSEILTMKSSKSKFLNKGAVSVPNSKFYKQGTIIDKDDKKYLCLRDTDTYCKSPNWIIL